MPYITVADSRVPQPGVPGHLFISPRDKVSQLYPQALGSLFIVSYDLHGYGDMY
jgi:hypothetical protein